jgi:hypothetical protein
MTDFVKHELGIEPDTKASPNLPAPGLDDGLMVSPQMILAIEGLARTLGNVELASAVGAVPPCPIGPLEEFGMPWRSPLSMVDLLSSRDTTLQLAAMDALEKLRANGEVIPPNISSLMAKWVDDNLLSDSRNVAARAWHCAEMDREDGREERYARAAKIKHSTILSELPRRARLVLGTNAIPLLRELGEKGGSSDLRNSAMAELALIYSSAGADEEITGMLLNAEITAFSKILETLESEGYKLDSWSVVRLLSADCPLITGRNLGGERVQRQEVERNHIRQQLVERASQAIACMDVIEVPKDVDFSLLARVCAADRELSILLASIVSRMEKTKALGYMDMMLAYGGANGDAAAARVIEESRIRDAGLLVRAGEMNAISSLRALIANGAELMWLENAMNAAAGNWRVRAAYEIAKAAKPAGPEWLSARYQNMLATATDTGAAAQFLGYVMYLSILEKWSDHASILLASGADLEIKEKSTGNTLLHAAATVGDIALAEALIRRGAQVTAKNSAESTPVHIAAEQGFTDLVSMLIKGGDVRVLDGCDGSGRTAIILAAQKGHMETVRVLLDAGASPRIMDKGRKNAAQRALESGHPDLGRYIFDRMR